MLKRSIIAGAIAAAVALAGCGSSSSNSSGPSLSAFKTGFEAQKTSFNQLGADLQKAISTAPSSSNSQIASEFASLATRTTAQSAALRKLKPPAKYSAALSQLASGFDTVAGDMQAISLDSTNNDAIAVKPAAVKLITDSAAVKAADLSLTHRLGLPTTG
jgi:hypothetical protein